MIDPIKARCRRCRGEFTLVEVVDERSGLCPRCGWMLTPDWAPALLDESNRASRAQDELVLSLHRLSAMPGNVLLLPHPVLRNLFEEVGWECDLFSEPDTGAEELHYVHEYVSGWERLGSAEADRRGQSWLGRVFGHGRPPPRPHCGDR